MSQGPVADDASVPRTGAEERAVAREDDVARNRSKQGSDGTTTERVVRPAVNKREAVRRALAELGPKARPPQIQQFIRERYAVEMAPNHISSYKSSILKMAARKPAEPAEEQTPPAKGTGISLEDIKTIKELAARIGVQRLRELVELLVE